MTKDALLFIEEREAYIDIQRLVKKLNYELRTAVTKKGLRVDVDIVYYKEVPHENIIHKLNVNIYRRIIDAN